MQNKKNRRPAKRTATSSSTRRVPQNVKKYVKSVTRRTRPEMKKALALQYILGSGGDEMALDTAAGGSGYAAYRFNVNAGIAANQRIGNEVYLHGCHIKGVLHNNSTTNMWIRRLILSHVDNEGETNTYPELFVPAAVAQSPNADFTTVTGLNRIYTSINKNRYHVYDDSVIKLATSSSTTGGNTKFFNKFQKFSGKKICFDGNTTGVSGSDPGYGKVTPTISVLFILAEAPDDASTGVTIELSNQINFYFTDP